MILVYDFSFLPIIVYWEDVSIESPAKVLKYLKFVQSSGKVLTQERDLPKKG